jgi:hypothetical protein
MESCGGLPTRQERRYTTGAQLAKPHNEETCYLSTQV